MVGSCDQNTEKDFYNKIVATNESDIGLIKAEILEIFKSVEVFNEVVENAIQEEGLGGGA